MPRPEDKFYTLQINKSLKLGNHKNNNKVRFNAIRLAGQGWQFLL